ncbi:unnamed protein product [Arctogadus glacialis]
MGFLDCLKDAALGGFKQGCSPASGATLQVLRCVAVEPPAQTTDTPQGGSQPDGEPSPLSGMYQPELCRHKKIKYANAEGAPGGGPTLAPRAEMRNQDRTWGHFGMKGARGRLQRKGQRTSERAASGEAAGGGSDGASGGVPVFAFV